MTTRDLIKASLRLLGVIATGETPSAAETSDSRDALNRMLGNWSTDSLMCIAMVREEFTLTSGTARYSMGPSGDFDTTRPIEIVKAKLEDQSNTPTPEYDLDVVNVEQWADITTKDLQSQIPTTLYPEGTSPLEFLNLYPVPSAANKLVLYSRKAIASLALDDVIDLPPGWEDALVTNLAVKLGPEFNKPISPDLLAQAIEAKASIKRQNIRTHLMRSDAPLLGQPSAFNIFKGDF